MGVWLVLPLVLLTASSAIAQDVAQCISPATGGVALSAELLAAAVQVVQPLGQSPVDLAAVSAVLSTQGFKCAALSVKEGLSCVGRIGTYPRDVALLVAPGYRMTTEAEAILHLHGNNPAHGPIQGYLRQYQYSQLLASTGRNAVMIAPLSFGKTEDFEQQLADGPHFRGFMAAAATLMKTAGLTQTAEVGSITLTGFSGAYRALSTILENGEYATKINELYLLDSGYGRAPAFADFALNPKHRFWTVYHPADKDLREAHEEMLQRMKEAGQPPYQAPSTALSDEELRDHRVGFIHSDVGHGQTLSKYFPVFLKARP